MTRSTPLDFTPVPPPRWSRAACGLFAGSLLGSCVGGQRLASGQLARKPDQLARKPAQLDPVRRKAELRARFNRYVQSRVRYGTFSGGSPRDRVVALTFDDGPDPKVTPRILDILKRERVPATFFVLGMKARLWPHLLQRAVAEGHDLGNHTYHHYPVPTLTEIELKEEIGQTERIIQRAVGSGTRWFRAPGCAYTPEALTTLRSLKLVRVDTLTNSADYASPSVDGVLWRTLTHLKPGAVILCHDRTPETIAALPQLIRRIRRQGYRFVSLGEMALRSMKDVAFEPVAWPQNEGVRLQMARIHVSATLLAQQKAARERLKRVQASPAAIPGPEAIPTYGGESLGGGIGPAPIAASATTGGG